MKLTAFQISDFRSIKDSTRVELTERTVLVGRNESGKTSLLKVLSGLKPAGPLPEFSHARDFPRDRPRHDFDRDAVVLKTWWGLSDSDLTHLGKLWPRAATARTIEVGRNYAPTRYVGFTGITPLDGSPARALGGKLREQASAADPALRASLLSAVGAVETALSKDLREDVSTKWAADVTTAIASLKPILASQPALSELLRTTGAVEEAVGAIGRDGECHHAARKWAVDAMPMFVYMDDWEKLPGHYDISGYVARTRQNQQTPEDKLFTKLLKVAELDADELNTLLSQNHEERKLLTNRASRVVTKTLRKLWKDRKLTVEFSLDANHFDVVVSDEETDALVPLDERSRGFRWYFSFFVVFAADTDGGEKENAILLLDEPGLFLHATAQANLLAFLDTLPNQIIYTTHSPFMIDPARISSVRTVNLTEGTGTVVSAEPTGDSNTLFPLQAALGYDLTQTLFVGNRSVLVEGVTDYWYLSTVSEFFADEGREGLSRDIVLTPAGGAPKIPYMLALLTAQRLNVVVLFDSEPQAEAKAKSLVSEKLIRPEGVIYVGEAFPVVPRGGADIEDLFDPDDFLRLVLECYKPELGGKVPEWNPSIPRVARRAEEALSRMDIKFNKTRPARLFLRRMAEAPESLMSPTTRDRFEKLFRALNSAVGRLVKSDRPPFH
jgi:energy-coupling factor transporter ATP-binding protein EcfA2